MPTDTLLAALDSALQTLHISPSARRDAPGDGGGPGAPFAGALWLLTSRDAEAIAALEACLDPARADVRERFLATMLQGTARRLTALHQFAVLDAATGRQIVRVGLAGVRALRDVLRGADDPEVLELAIPEIALRHRERIETLLRDQLDPALDPEVGAEAPVCAQYSPETQVAVLGLDLEDLGEPVLDLGCGQEARLVYWLRQNDVDAYGVDRHAAPGPWTEQADWMTHPLQARHWGTIVSHMAFSNHFIHHHLHPRGQALACARRYMQVLAALAPGGRFIYAPGLPFIEALLDPTRYRLERHPIAALRGHDAVVALASRIGEDVAFATHVTVR